jgi:hypothetical protein
MPLAVWPDAFIVSHHHMGLKVSFHPKQVDHGRDVCAIEVIVITSAIFHLPKDIGFSINQHRCLQEVFGIASVFIIIGEYGILQVGFRMLAG